MKRSGDLFARAFTVPALTKAFADASKSKRMRRACFNFERHLGAEIMALHAEIHSGAYKPRPYFSFTVHKPKTRIIYAPAFRDCVVQHAIYSVVGPVFENTFIDHSFACRRGFGTHKAADYAQQALIKSRPDSYTIKLDIRKFFYRIDRDILGALIAKKIKDARMLNIMMQFADYGEPQGIPIGNLLSQLYALIYLNPLDHFIKRDLKIKRYCRYVDDFVLFDISKDQAIIYRARIVEFLRDKLKLELSRSTIAPTARGLNFVGYRTWRTRRFIRKRSLYNFRQAVKNNSVESAASIIGHARKTHSMQHLLRHAQERNHDIYLQLPKIYHARSDSRVKHI
jgi:RNA-directed DNA polymerase